MIVGASDLSAAIERQAELIGWAAADRHPCRRGDGRRSAPSTTATPSSSSTTTRSWPRRRWPPRWHRNIGYVGALGSRRTQQHRRQHLADVGVSADAIERLHGPAGLDLGARNPAETAVSIVAEMIAARAGRTGEALTDTTGRING